MNFPPITLVDNDDAALDALDNICTVESSEQILAGAFLAVIRAYEKHAKYEEFATMLRQCVELHDLVARIRFLNATKLLLQKQTIEQEGLDISIANITSRAEHCRNKLLKNMQLVRKIPSQEITKH